jgi:hypothetical protein
MNLRRSEKKNEGGRTGIRRMEEKGTDASIQSYREVKCSMAR